MEDNGGGGGGFGYTNFQNHHHFRSSPRLSLDRFLWSHHQSQFTQQLVPNVVEKEETFFSSNSFYDNYTNFENDHHRSSPRLSLDRFWWPHHQSQFTQQEVPDVVEKKETLLPAKGFYDVSSSSSLMGGENSSRHAASVIGASWPNLQEVSFFDGSFLHGENDVRQRVHRSEALNSNVKESSGKEVKYRSSTSTPLVKGQWTDEEDRNLIGLVKQYGVRKWAQVAENIVGRAGKQCRERWQNHLRPDIKKDSWSEEEEKLLIEAHEELGNKWSEIAKRIPGRTENSIKNHWNAAKRREHSRRRNKRRQDNRSKMKSTVLQDYMKTKYLTTTPPNSTISEGPSIQFHPVLSPSVLDDSLSLLIQQPCHDEDLSFMQNLFGKSTTSYPTMGGDGGKLLSNASNITNGNSHKDSVEDSCSLYLAVEPNLYNMGGDPEYYPIEECSPPQVNHYPPDHYLSCLLDGATPCSSSSSIYVDSSYSGGSTMGVVVNQGSYSCSSLSNGETGKDIDLMELICSSL